jgi:hypothetical protein
MNLIDKLLEEGYTSVNRPTREEVEEALVGWAMLYGFEPVEVGHRDRWVTVLWGATNQSYPDAPLTYIGPSTNGKYDTMQMNDIGRRMLDEILNR